MKFKLLLIFSVLMSIVTQNCLYAMGCLNKYIHNYEEKPVRIIYVPEFKVNLQVVDILADCNNGYRALNFDDNKDASRVALLDALMLKLNEGDDQIRQLIAPEIVFNNSMPDMFNLDMDKYFAENAIFAPIRRAIRIGNINEAMAAARASDVAEAYINFLMHLDTWMQLPAGCVATGICDAIAYSLQKNLAIIDGRLESKGNVLHRYQAKFQQTVCVVFTPMTCIAFTQYDNIGYFQRAIIIKK